MIIVYTIINYGIYHNKIWHIPYLNVAYTLIKYSIYHNKIYLKCISFIYMYLHMYVFVHEIYTGMYRKSLLNTLKLTYPAGGLKFGLRLYLHPYFAVCASSRKGLVKL